MDGQTNANINKTIESSNNFSYSAKKIPINSSKKSSETLLPLNKNKPRRENVFHKKSGAYIGFIIKRDSSYVYVSTREGKKIRCLSNTFDELYEVRGRRYY